MVVGGGAGCCIMPLSLDPTAVLVRLAADDGTVFGVFCTTQMTAPELGHSQASAATQSQLT